MDRNRKKKIPNGECAYTFLYFEKYNYSKLVILFITLPVNIFNMSNLEILLEIMYFNGCMLQYYKIRTGCIVYRNDFSPILLRYFIIVYKQDFILAISVPAW